MSDTASASPVTFPGWEGSQGPFREQYGQPHVYARDVRSGAGNCVCGADLGDDRHVQAAPGVPVPLRQRHPGSIYRTSLDIHSGRE